jgi:hypothetical protein
MPPRKLRFVYRFEVENNPRTYLLKDPPKRFGEIQGSNTGSNSRTIRDEEALKTLQIGRVKIEISDAKLRFIYRFKSEN